MGKTNRKLYILHRADITVKAIDKISIGIANLNHMMKTKGDDVYRAMYEFAVRY